MHHVLSRENVIRRWPAALLCALATLCLVVLPVRAAVDETPAPVASGNVEEWAVGAGLVYWADHCYGDEFNSVANLRRKPTGGGIIRPLAAINDGNLCNTFQNLLSSGDGLYYFDRSQQQIARMPLGEPFTPELVKALSSAQIPNPAKPFVEAHDHLYWIAEFDPLVLRTRKDGTGEIETVANTTGQARDILIVGNTVYWTDGGGVWSIGVGCDTLPCAGTQQSYYTFGAGNFAYGLVYQFFGGVQGNYRIYWVQRATSGPNSTYTIYYRGCNAISNCYAPPAPPQLPPLPPVYYTATVNWRIGYPVLVGGNLFWTEADTSSVNNNNGDVKRATTTIPPNVETIATLQTNQIDDQLFVSGDLLYFARRGNGVYSLSLAAEAIRREFEIKGMEVTQAIQSLNNEVPLVATKPTYVRVYGAQVLGPNAPNVEAHLVGLRNGAPILGSPLQPLNGVRGLVTGGSFNRARLDDGWVFLLPESWTTAGAITLRAVIDPRLMHNDTNRANNEQTVNVAFQNQPPVCVWTIPVRTHTPLPSINDPNFWSMISHFDRRWPVPATWVFRDTSPVEELQVCTWYGVPYPCFGPYELEDGWGLTNGMPDRDKVIVSLWARAQLSFNPDVCDDIGAPVHFMGLVHPNANNGGAAGYASTVSKQSWVQLPPHTPNPMPATSFAVRAGATMAQELAHNFGRKHVNCGNPDDVDNNYPYPPCELSNSNPQTPATHFGFDTVLRQPIQPNAAADFMSYAGNRWVSDYTWKSLLNAFAAAQVSMAAPLAPAQGDSVFIGGVIDTGNNRGGISVALVMPTASVPPATRLALQEAAVRAAHDDGPHAAYTVRLLGIEGNIIFSNTVPIFPLDDHVGDSDSVIFGDLFAPPAEPVATIQLLADGVVLDSRSPGIHKPSVAIQQPGAGVQISNTLTLHWTATDPDPDDRLVYTVQYSHDDGASWHTLMLNRPGTTELGESLTFSNVLTLDDLGTLRGSAPNAARIRILANDGFNTAIATSDPFTLLNRPPEPAILAPSPGQSFAAGAAILLQGSAIDAEDGGLSGDALHWQVNGSDHGSGATQVVAGLAPGDHSATLRATDANSQTASTGVNFTITPLAIPLGSAPTLDGLCTDANYAQGSSLLLRPYADGSQAIVQIVRSADYLWLCFSGLQQGPDNSLAYVGARVDINHSREAQAQATDAGFFVGEDGSVFTRAGDGAGGFGQPGPGGLQGQINVEGELWSAELRIAAATLGGWDHLVGLALGHYQVEIPLAHAAAVEVGTDHLWPYVAVSNAPNTWATTALGSQSSLTALDPFTATAQGPAFTLAVEGSGFISGTVVLWQDVALPTTFVDGQHLTATVDAAQIATAGLVQVKTRGPAPGNLESNALVFVVETLAPAITALSPARVGEGSPALTLTVDGSGFAADAQVVWDGEVLPTQFISPTRVTAQISAARLFNGQTVGVAVRNPTPTPATSALREFTVEPRSWIYLPALER